MRVGQQIIPILKIISCNYKTIKSATTAQHPNTMLIISSVNSYELYETTFSSQIRTLEYARRIKFSKKLNLFNFKF